MPVWGWKKYQQTLQNNKLWFEVSSSVIKNIYFQKLWSSSSFINTSTRHYRSQTVISSYSNIDKKKLSKLWIFILEKITFNEHEMLRVELIFMRWFRFVWSVNANLSTRGFRSANTRHAYSSASAFSVENGSATSMEPESAITQSAKGLSRPSVLEASILRTTLIPLRILPKTTCLPSSQVVCCN